MIRLCPALSHSILCKTGISGYAFLRETPFHKQLLIPFEGGRWLLAQVAPWTTPSVQFRLHCTGWERLSRASGASAYSSVPAVDMTYLNCCLLIFLLSCLDLGLPLHLYSWTHSCHSALTLYPDSRSFPSFVWLLSVSTKTYTSLTPHHFQTFENSWTDCAFEPFPAILWHTCMLTHTCRYIYWVWLER